MTSPTGVDHSTLAEFTLNLAKAMLRTGYYAPDHPESKQSLEGLHDEFRRAVGDESGLTYMVEKVGDTETVMLQGHGEEPQSLDHIMIRGMAEMFAPKLLDFFHRRHLVSFSLRAPISAEQLSAFVILMSTPPRAGQAGEERQRVEKVFLDHRILDVSTVFEADIVGRERRLPWRVKLALSRLGRDLRMLPLYKKASPKEITRVKIQIIDDVIRPMQTPHLVKDLLLNCDLLAADIQLLRSAQIEREIIAQVSPERLKATCQEIANELEEAAGEAEGSGDPLADRGRLVLRHVLIGLIKTGIQIDTDLMEACVKLGAVTFEEIPKKLRKQLKRRRAVDTFLVRQDDYLKAFSHIPQGEPGTELVKMAEVLFSELLGRERYVEAASILEAVRAGVQEGEGGEAARGLVDTLREAMAEKETHRPLIKRLKSEEEKAVADALVQIIIFTGEPAIPRLRKLYRKNESRHVRAHVFKAIQGIGPLALIPFLTHLDEVEDEWSAIHHILAALAGVDDPALAEPIKPFLGHENARVRQVALTRVFELKGDAAEDRLLEAMGDPDPTVRQTAVAYLGRLQSRHPRALAFFTSALRSEQGAESTENRDEVLAEICRTLALVAEAYPEDAPGFEQLLRSALARSDEAKLIHRLRRSKPHYGDRVRIAICESLGSLGTEASLTELRALASGEGAVAEASLAAADRIVGRVAE